MDGWLLITSEKLERAGTLRLLGGARLAILRFVTLVMMCALALPVAVADERDKMQVPDDDVEVESAGQRVVELPSGTAAAEGDKIDVTTGI